jgi:ATP-dependent DNA helicase PIF1
MSAPAPSSTSDLSPGQQAALQLVKTGRNILLGGGAGSGKSYLISAILAWLRTQHFAHEIGVTALTGMAASLINGNTFHGWSGMGLATDSAERIADKIKRFAPSLFKLQQCKAVIVDEVSLMSGDFLDKINRVFQLVRDSTEPCGGIQLIFVGDLYQLLPVNKKEGLVFEAKCFDECFPPESRVELDKVFRQTDDAFIRFLGEVRVGRLSDESVQFLNALDRPLDVSDGIKPTVMHPTNKDVTSENNLELAKLDGPSTCYTAIDAGADTDILNKSFSAEHKLELKPGAQVMLVVNSYFKTYGLVNGSRGVVEACNDATVTVKFQGDRLVAITRHSFEKQVSKYKSISRYQMPLKLAWALSVHKAQGTSLDKARANLKSAFCAGQVYVTLSRARSAEGLHVPKFDHSRIMTEPKVVKFYEQCKAYSEEQQRGVKNKAPEEEEERAGKRQRTK